MTEVRTTMTDLKSEHFWRALEDAKRDHSPDDTGVIYAVAWAMLDDIRALQQELAHCQQAATALAMLSDDEAITGAWFPDEATGDD